MKPSSKATAKITLFVSLLIVAFLSIGFGQSRNVTKKKFISPAETSHDFSIDDLDTLKILSANRKDRKIFLTVSLTREFLAKFSPPPSLKISINGKVAQVFDTGKYPDVKGGDGIYTIAGKPNFIETTAIQEVYAIKNGGLTPVFSADTHSERFVWKCRGRITTNCPPDCKSIIFKQPCIVCIVFDCSITWEGEF